MDKHEESSEFTGLSRDEIVGAFEELLKSKDIQELLPVVEEIDSAYKARNDEREEEERQEFLDNGGYAADFVLQKDKTDSKFTELYNIFRDRKDKFREEQKAQTLDNLYAKRKVIDDLKALIEKGDSVGKAFQQFRELRDKWNATGDVQKKEEQQLESDYRFQRERFFHLIHITQGMKELDLQKHTEEKENILRQMEELLQERTIRKAETLIRKFHNDWYDIGPVTPSKKDEVIKRFNDLTNKVYAKIRGHYETLKRKYEENLQAKVALCEKVESLDFEELNSHRNWERKTKEILDFQTEWRKTGRASKEDADAIWERFRNACNVFFERKRAFYETLKKDNTANKQAKLKICEQAEAFQNNTAWDDTAHQLIRLQKQWEKSGPAGNPKDEQQLWKRFRAACDFFFEAKKQHFAAAEDARKNNLAAREAIIKKLEELIPSIASKEAMPAIKAITREWDEAGEVPNASKEALFKKYTQTLDACYEKMGMEPADKELLQYNNKLERMRNAPDASRLLDDERKFVRNKIRSLEDEIAKLENNMGFFAKSSKTNILLQGVQENVNQNKEQLTFFRKKLDALEKAAPRKAEVR